jgi:hypothetical protein
MLNGKIPVAAISLPACSAAATGLERAIQHGPVLLAVGKPHLRQRLFHRSSKTRRFLAAKRSKHPKPFRPLR